MGKTKSELLYAEVLVKFAKVKKRNKFMYDVTVNQIQSLLNYEKEWYEAASNKLVTMWIFEAPSKRHCRAVGVRKDIVTASFMMALHLENHISTFPTFMLAINNF